MKKINVALFVPHRGCPNQCSFCNQKSISGEMKKITKADVKKAVETALKSSDCTNGEIAFFGGSFTAIEKEYMLELLDEASKYVRQGLFEGIRISTRPDAIDDEICKILKEHCVTSVELGCQSMVDVVLLANRRGHTAEDVRNATKMLKKFGFVVGHQMMTGLYKSNYDLDIFTAKEIIGLKPDTVRIYPTIVLENTELCEKYRKKEYKIMSDEETVELCAKLLLMFYESGIKVIRVGLHSGGNVEEGYVAGTYHPAFKELCESKIYLEKIKEQAKNIESKKIIVYVAPDKISAAIGQKRSNVEQLKNMGIEMKAVASTDVGRYEVKVEEQK